MNEYDAVAMGVAVLGCVLLVLGLSKRSQPWPIRIAKLAIAVCCLVGGKLHFVQESRAGSFASEADFLEQQKRDGFVKIGRFDESWPAEYVCELLGEDQISFTRQDGTPHNYRGFDGYRLKVVRLRDVNGREPMYVLRSQFKH
jgi:hypothetical protein